MHTVATWRNTGCISGTTTDGQARQPDARGVHVSILSRMITCRVDMCLPQGYRFTDWLMKWAHAKAIKVDALSGTLISKHWRGALGEEEAFAGFSQDTRAGKGLARRGAAETRVCTYDVEVEPLLTLTLRGRPLRPKTLKVSRQSPLRSIDFGDCFPCDITTCETHVEKCPPDRGRLEDQTNAPTTFQQWSSNRYKTGPT